MSATAARGGPRPLGLHLSAAATLYWTSNAALPLLSGGWPGLPQRTTGAAEARTSREALRTTRPATPPGLERALADAAPGPLAGAVEREARRRFERFLTGVERYREHGYRRALSDPPALWRSGSSVLRDYAASGGSGGQDGRPAVLLVPSLINRGYILDLSERRSLARWLAANGIRPFLMDWGAPGPEEVGFTLTDYVAGRLEDALDAACVAAGGPVAVLGYCMGGLLALALGLRRSHQVSSLALLATPWDFHAGDAALARGLAAAVRQMEPLLTVTGTLPVDMLQGLFAALDPFLAVRKFQRFADLDPDGPAAQQFVALEDWINDGVPLTAAVARECAAGWYGANTPANLQWRIAGRSVDPGAYAGPAYVVVPATDRIVPPPSAEALARMLPGAVVQRPAIGHIGMIASASAVERVWAPLAAWLRRSS